MKMAFGNRLRGTLAAIAVAALLSACAGIEPMKIPEIEAPAPLEIGPDQALLPIIFTKGVVTIRRGTVVGHLPQTYPLGGVYGLCNYRYNPSSTINWRSGGRMRVAGLDGELASVFFEAMNAAGYDVKGNPEIMFKRDEDLNAAKYQVGAQITGINSNICDFFTRSAEITNKSMGDMYMKVRWSVFSPLERRTVAQFVTEGRAKQDRPISGGFGALFVSVFGSAAEALGANREFLKLVSQPSVDTAVLHTPAGSGPITIKRLKLSRTALSVDSAPVVRATVTIRSGLGHGSGFIVSKSGYLLTNHHVVGDSKIVRVVFPSRLEVNGRVVRSHPLRDVALIKIEIGGLRPLPIRTELPRIAETVYAIGSPLEEDLHSTITRGVVSALRRKEQTKLMTIQADVDISSGNSGGPLVDARGNVVGISVAKIMRGSSSTGLNLFIPIASALELLDVKIADGK